MNRVIAILTAGLVVLLCVLGAGCFGPDGTPGEQPSEYFEMEKEVLGLINAHRASQGLAELDYDRFISDQCLAHSEKMASGEVEFSHDGFQERAENIKDELGPGPAAENVAWNMGTADPARTAVDGWLNSTGHRKNIEGDYTLTGIGIARSGDGGYYLTQMFYRPSA